MAHVKRFPDANATGAAGSADVGTGTIACASTSPFTSCPAPPRPEHSPEVPVTAHVSPSPPKSAVRPVPIAGTGTELLTPMPLPNSPSRFCPQHFATPPP